MKKLFALFIAAAISIGASAATLVPIQLLNPAGSTSGQAIVSTGASTAPAWGGVGVNGIAAIAANTVLSNATGSSTSPTAFAMPSCSTSASALNWTTSTGFTCNTAVNAAQLGGATFVSPGPIGSTTASTGAFTTLSSTGNFTPSQTNGIVGTTTNNLANAGSVGEIIQNTSTLTSITNNVAVNATSISLTAGDWDVTGIVGFIPAGSTVISFPTSCITTVSATVGAFGTFSQSGATYGAGNGIYLTPPTQRISIASTTTVYLVSQAGIATSTATVSGNIRARRIR